MAQRVGRGIALLFHDRGTRRGWVVSSKPLPHFTPGKDPVPILQEAGWSPGPVWTGGKSRTHRDSIPDRPARSQSIYRLSYPAHINLQIVYKILLRPHQNSSLLLPTHYSNGIRFTFASISYCTDYYRSWSSPKISSDFSVGIKKKSFKMLRIKISHIYSLTLYRTTSTSTAGLNWIPYDSHITHAMLPQLQINITK